MFSPVATLTMKTKLMSFTVVIFQLAILGAAGTGSDQQPLPNDGPAEAKIKLKESDRMRKARAVLHADFVRLFRTDEERKKVLAYDLTLAKQHIVKSKDFQDLFRIRFWCGENPSIVVPWLIEKLDD